MSAGAVSAENEQFLEHLGELCRKLDGAEGKVVVNFTEVSRLAAPEIAALRRFVGAAEEKKITIVCRGVSVTLFKVLQLERLTERLSFLD